MKIHKKAMFLKAALKQACWKALEFSINRHLMANAEGRLDGNEKAETHLFISKFLTEVFSLKDYHEFHDLTQKFTGSLDKAIGFPLKGRPDYDVLAPKLFEKFFEAAYSEAGI